MKTDGYHIYYLQGSELRIIGVPEFGQQFGQLTEASKLDVEGSPTAMMLDGDSLVILSRVSPWSGGLT